LQKKRYGNPLYNTESHRAGLTAAARRYKAITFAAASDPSKSAAACFYPSVPKDLRLYSRDTHIYSENDSPAGPAFIFLSSPRLFDEVIGIKDMQIFLSY